MAQRPGIAFALLVLGLHLLLLEWLGQSLPSASILQQVVQPMLTREIRQSAAPEAPKPQSKKPSRHTARASSASKSIADTAATNLSDTSGGEPQAAVTPQIEPSTPDAATATVATSSPAGTATGTPSGAVVGPSNPPAGEPASPPGTGWPGNTRLSYALTGFYRGNVTGDAQVRWQHEGGRYQVLVDIDMGIISTRMTSQGLIGAEQLEPRAYEEKTTGINPRPLLLEANRIRLMGGDWVERPPGVQDTASQFVDLAHRFTNAPEQLAVGKTVTLWLARPGGVDQWVYDVIGLETLESQRLGSVAAYHLKPRQLAKPRGPVNAEIWFAPSLQYLPVRIRLSIGADAWLDLMVEKIEQ